MRIIYAKYIYVTKNCLSCRKMEDIQNRRFELKHRDSLTYHNKNYRQEHILLLALVFIQSLKNKN